MTRVRTRVMVMGLVRGQQETEGRRMVAVMTVRTRRVVLAETRLPSRPPRRGTCPTTAGHRVRTRRPGRQAPTHPPTRRAPTRQRTHRPALAAPTHLPTHQRAQEPLAARPGTFQAAQQAEARPGTFRVAPDVLARQVTLLEARWGWTAAEAVTRKLSAQRHHSNCGNFREKKESEKKEREREQVVDGLCG